MFCLTLWRLTILEKPWGFRAYNCWILGVKLNIQESLSARFKTLKMNYFRITERTSWKMYHQIIFSIAMARLKVICKKYWVYQENLLFQNFKNIVEKRNIWHTFQYSEHYFWNCITMGILTMSLCSHLPKLLLTYDILLNCSIKHWKIVRFLMFCFQSRVL